MQILASRESESIDDVEQRGGEGRLLKYAVASFEKGNGEKLRTRYFAPPAGVPWTYPNIYFTRSFMTVAAEVVEIFFPTSRPTFIIISSRPHIRRSIDNSIFRRWISKRRSPADIRCALCYARARARASAGMFTLHILCDVNNLLNGRRRICKYGKCAQTHRTVRVHSERRARKFNAALY